MSTEPAATTAILDPAEPGRAPLIFVVGSSRSGTTMMGNVLGLHSRVFMFRELHFFEKLWTGRDRARSLDPEEAADLAAHLLCIQRDGILFQGDRRRYLAEAAEVLRRVPAADRRPAAVFAAFLRYEAEVNDRAIGCDQTPRNIFYIGEILELYPEARVVVMVRDPRDVLLSQKNKWKMRFAGLNHDPYAEALRLKVDYHPITTTLLWKAAVAAGHRWAGAERVHLVRFEDVLEAPERELRAICDFLGLTFEPHMLEVQHVNSSFTGTRAGGRGIDRSVGGRWQTGGLTATEMHLCQRVAGEYMTEFGYAAADVDPNRFALALSLLLFPLKAGLAVLFNLSRIRNLPEALRRRFGTPH